MIQNRARINQFFSPFFFLSRSVVLTVLAVGIPSILLAQNEAVYHNIADSLVHRVLTEDLDHTEAEDLIGRARRIDPENGDAIFIAAGFIADSQGDQQDRETLLRRALSVNLRRVSPSDVVGELADVLLSQHRYREVVDLFYREAHAGRVPLPMVYGVLPVAGGDTAGPQDVWNDNRIGSLAQKFLAAQLRVGPYWYSTSYLQRLRSRYPLDTTLAIMDFTREERVSLAYLEWIDSSVASGKGAPLDILLYGVRTASDGTLRRELAARYLSQGGEDPLVFLAADMEGVFHDKWPSLHWQEDKVFWEYAYDWYGASDGDTGDLVPAFPPMPKDITLVVDEDRDTFWEERYHFTDGRLVVWEDDRDQNGLVNRRIEIDHDSRRVELFFEAAEELYHIHYAPYPRVTTVVQVEYNEADGARAVRWIPANPPTYPTGIGNVLEATWNGRRRRVTVVDDLHSRFSRQLRSDDAHILSAEETQRFLQGLRERSMVH